MATYSDTTNSHGIHDMGALDGWMSGSMNLNYQGFAGDGHPMPIVTIANTSGHDEAFRAYWCPYEKNNAPFVTLSRHASYMFTAKMDGCSLGIGNVTRHGHVYVAHANCGGVGDQQICQLKGHSKISRHGGLKSMYGPDQYRQILDKNGVSKVATVFGIRDTKDSDRGTWKFYSQVVVVDRNQKRLVFCRLDEIA